MDDADMCYLENVVDNLAPNMAQCMCDGPDEVDLLVDQETLTTPGRQWLRGFLTARLSTFRSGRQGQPGLSADDLESVSRLVEREQTTIAAELYS